MKGRGTVNKPQHMQSGNSIFWILAGAVSFFMGAAVYYTSKIGWYPQSADWKGQTHILRSTDAFHILPWAALSFGGLYILFQILEKIREKDAEETLPHPLTGPPFALTVFFLLLMWMPFFLVFFPGTGMNDTTDILRYGFWAAGQHTFLYCLYLGGLGAASDFLTGSMTAGMAAASLIQMFLMALALAGAVTWLYRRTGSSWGAAALALYYGLTPMIVNYSFADVKDTFFSVIMLLWIPLLYELEESQDQEKTWKRWRGEFIIFSLGLLMLRNNGPYVYLVLMICLTAVLSQIRWTVMITGTLLFFMSMIPNLMLNIFMDLPQLFQERVGIPIQQVARVVDSGKALTPGESAYISRIMWPGKMISEYDPFTADGIKWDRYFDQEYCNAHPEEFMKTWRSLGKRYPEIYMEAWMLATYGYWSFPAPDGETQSRFGWAVSPEDMEQGMNPADNNAYQSGTVLRLLPPDIQEKMGRYLFNHSRYLGAGTCFWMMTAVSLFLIKRKKYRKLIILLPAFLCWGTLMAATPAAFVYRYVFFFPLCMPLFLMLPFLPDRPDKRNQQKKLFGETEQRNRDGSFYL